MNDKWAAIYRKNILFAVAAFGNSIWIFYTYLSITFIGAYEPASLYRVLSGTAEKPYIYRILVPALAKLIANFTPETVTNWFNNSPRSVYSTFTRLSSNGCPKEASVVLLIMFLSLPCLAFAEKVFLADLGFDDKEQFILPLIVHACILPVNMFTGYYYDFLQMLLMTLCLIFLYRQNWLVYLTFLAIANINKETSAFILAVYIIYFWRRIPQAKFLKLFTWQITIIGVIRYTMIRIYWDNAGRSILYTIPDQIKIYQEHPLSLLFTIAYFTVGIYLVLRKWNLKNKFLRAASIIGLIIFVLFVPSGFPLEFRIFLEALPVLAILMFASIRKS